MSEVDGSYRLQRGRHGSGKRSPLPALTTCFA